MSSHSMILKKTEEKRLSQLFDSKCDAEVSDHILFNNESRKLQY